MSKIAVAGKGGVGKTTFSALLSYVLATGGETVYAIDADPNATLGQALGFPPDLLAQLVPIIDMKDLIEERTGARPGESGAYFRLNPRVDDIPARFSVSHRGIRLLEMGAVRGAGAGCVCPENTMVRALVSHLLLRERETVLLDMVAGLEHLGRGTAASVDAMFIVAEPGQRSLTRRGRHRSLWPRNSAYRPSGPWRTRSGARATSDSSSSTSVSCRSPAGFPATIGSWKPTCRARLCTISPLSSPIG